jgi:hypothetical protein
LFHGERRRNDLEAQTWKERGADQRNSEPIIHRERAAREPTAKHLSASVWTGEVAFDLGPIHVSEPHGWLSGFEREQPYALAIFGEKASLEDILLPIAQRYGADLYLQTGEISDTRIHQMAKDASEDGRPFVVITVTDFDPSGRQMSVSIGRKLQAFADTIERDIAEPSGRLHRPSSTRHATVG